MKKFYFAVIIFCYAFPVFAQDPVADSIKLEKKHYAILKLEKELLERREKLEKLEKELDSKIKSANYWDKQASREAEENSVRADRLNNDPTSRKLARKAHKAAKDARKDAKRARKAKSALESHYRSIEAAKKKMQSTENELGKLRLELQQFESNPGK